MNKLLTLVGILVCVNAVLANDYFETGRPIISLYNKGGYVAAAAIANQLPEVKIWEDGTIIVATHDQQNKRKVLFSTVSDNEVTSLKDKVQVGGFLDLSSQYALEDAPTDGPSTCIKFWSTETNHKEVCEYVGGAPDLFHLLVTRLQSLKDSIKSKARLFFPVEGFVTAYSASCRASCDKVKVYTGPKLSTSGAWIKDLPALAQLWEAANNNEMMTDGSENYFTVSVQVDDLSLVCPTKTSDPRPLPTANNTALIIRFCALGLSGLMFILGLVLLIRIVRRRRQLKEKEMEQAKEVPMVETPAHSASTSTSVYEQPSTPQYVATQWAGQPSYVNTTPQYMVYYMQPTQTQQ